jgi:hypothetical protein
MATTQNITTTYSGRNAQKVMEASLLSGDTLASGTVDIHDNIQYKEVIQVYSTDDNLIKPGTCDFDATGTLTTTEIILEPKEIQVNLEICPKNLRSSWESLEMKGIKSGIPKTFGDFILRRVVEKTAADMENNIWKGTVAGNMAFDGWEVLANASAAAGNGVTLVAKAAITASNVTTELGRVFDAIPNTIKGKDDLYIYVPTAIYFAYVSALAGFGAVNSSATTSGIDGKYNTWYGNQQELTYNGAKVRHCPGMTSTDMLATTRANMIFGTSLFSELNEASVHDMNQIGSQNARVVLRGSASVALGIQSEIILYS